MIEVYFSLRSSPKWMQLNLKKRPAWDSWDLVSSWSFATDSPGDLEWDNPFSNPEPLQLMALPSLIHSFHDGPAAQSASSLQKRKDPGWRSLGRFNGAGYSYFIGRKSAPWLHLAAGEAVKWSLALCPRRRGNRWDEDPASLCHNETDNEVKDTKSSINWRGMENSIKSNHLVKR